ncbi:RINT-1 family protein [Moesziomyces antarcticus]|uniref:Uncharacterized protein n=2 Tax=Pseudozyma antarctica TaxID=84753 RepID=A0A5C3FLT1_PSEA2|nr:RINT-1 family protein [Moesziomyces antarcticus]GAK68226.1 RINT-1 family protein [Moesziomyces antarcticus]SPO45312.1 uncharacterized protein PSANT_02998 [Moesziomyces antarcticus]
MASSATLEPHQLAAYLQPPSADQQLSYVVEHCNYILPQLASDTLRASANDRADLRPTFTCLPSSDTLEAYLAQLTSAHQQTANTTAHLESQLRAQLLDSLSSVQTLKDTLSSLPDDIASTEDKLLDLCQDLVIQGAAASAPQSSRQGALTLMARLEQLHAAIDQLRKAKDYFTILAQAEDLRLAVISSEKDQPRSSRALEHLAELDALVRRVDKLSTAGVDAHNAGRNQPKLVAFLRAQRSAAFKALRKARCSRLSDAIAQSGWADTSATEQSNADSAIVDASTSAGAKLIDSEAVRQAWDDVCALQDAAEHLGLLKRATAKPPSKSQPTTSKPDAAASDAYQPLLTTQCLVEPMLLRFRYHFDGDRSTNRLDKPEWYLSHIAALIRSHAPLFLPAAHGVPGSGGPVARLNRHYANTAVSHRAYRHVDTYAELLHALLTPLRRKLASTMPALLDHPSLLAHTVFQALTFDADLETQFPPALSVLSGAGVRKISDDILGNPEWFQRWLDGEKHFALQRFEEIMDAPDAWAIGSSDSLADDDEQIFHSTLDGNSTSTQESSRTTKSARSTMEVLESVSERYRPLPSLSQRLAFVAIVQLPILRSYAQRLTRSLDAFESLSSAFARAMPGEIVASTGPAALVSGASDSDMVKGLRGLGRLVKALLSAQYVCSEIERWSESAAFVEMAASLGSTDEGRALALGMRKDEGDEENRELDAASLGMLLRRGLKRGAAVARPLTAGSNAPSADAGVGTPKITDVGQKQVLNEFGSFGVWEEPRRKFGDIAQRATSAIERLVVSETLEQLRPYIVRRWDQESLLAGEDQDELEAYPTPALVAALAIFSSHLGHLCGVLERESMLPIYRHIAASLATALVERVVMAGGSKRFNYAGGMRFRRDLERGWLGVVDELAASNAGSRFGRKPRAAWKPAIDTATLLTLLPSTEQGQSQQPDAGDVTLAKAVQIAFDSDKEHATDEYSALMQTLAIDADKINVRETLRRRVEVWK